MLEASWGFVECGLCGGVCGLWPWFWIDKSVAVWGVVGVSVTR